MGQNMSDEERDVIEKLRQTQEELDNEFEQDEIDDDRVLKLRYRQMLQSLYLQNFKGGF